jgi:hypothetical protein
VQLRFDERDLGDVPRRFERDAGECRGYPNAPSGSRKGQVTDERTTVTGGANTGERGGDAIRERLETEHRQAQQPWAQGPGPGA